MTEPRKGAVRRSDIPPEILVQLNDGVLATASLAESLAVDFRRLLTRIAPHLPSASLSRVPWDAGIVQRMRSVGQVLAGELSPQALASLLTHPSDTVRGWAAFALSALPGVSLDDRLVALRPLADDPHFGVREWAWCAIRPLLAEDICASIRRLSKWTEEASPNLRRFAAESTRPRGVWCAHIPLLKHEPEHGLPILEPLRNDESRYVQDSVANWLNDAAKSQPDWVKTICRQWQQANNTPATRRICQRAQRSL